MHIATQEFNELTADNFDERLIEANLACKNGIADIEKKRGFDEKLKTINKKLLPIKQDM